MQELEKILEEIESKEFTNMTIRHSMVVKMKDVRSIIRKHLSRENTTEITRCSQDTQGAEHEINLTKEEFELLRFSDSVTFRCGNEYISLYMGWDEATREYKNMNDGWIPVDKNNIPKNGVLACDRYENELIGYLSYNADAEEFVCESDECIMHQVIAWMEKPEPYRPERR